MFRPYILGFSILLLSACGTKGETQLFALGLGSNQSPQAIFDVRVESVAIDNNQSYLNAINVQPWGKFDALDLKNLKQSLADTFARNLPEESSTFESKLNVHLFIRRYVVSTSNTGGGVLATVTWAVTDSEGKLVFDEQFYAWSSGYLITTVGLVKTSAHKRIVRRIAITSMALASNTPAAEIRPAAIANTSTSLDEAISGLPKTLVSMGNPGLAAFPSSTISTIGLLTPSGAMDVQWEPSELSETFDWPEYLNKIERH